MISEPITIFNFRNELDEKVLERGWIYFLNNWASAAREILPTHFEVIVEEVNPHAVSFSMSPNGVFSNVFCTCGDSKHEFCRHMAAVIFVFEKKYFDEHKPLDWERLEEDSQQPFKK